MTDGVPPAPPEKEVHQDEASKVLGRVAVGASLMVAARFVIRGLSIIGMLVLARLLVAEDFGLVALSGAAVAFVEVLSVTNYGLLLVRERQPTRDLYDTAFTLNILRCLLIGLLIASTAHWQAHFLGDARIAGVLQVVSLIIILDGLTSIGMVRLQRDLHFDSLFRFQVVSKVVAFVVSVILALILQNYWSLVLGNLAARLVAIPYSYWLAPHQPRLSLRNAGQLLQFSGWMLGINALTTVDSQGPNLLLGRLLGLPALGTYQVAYFVAAMPVHEVAVPVRQPIYAGYAEVQGDRTLLREHFLDGFGLLAAVMVPLSVGIALTAPEIGRIALGPAWADAISLIALCALYSLADCLAGFSTNIFFVLDRMRPYVKTLALLVLLRMALIPLAILQWGVVGMATVMVGTAVLNAVLWHWQTASLLGHRLIDIAFEAWRSMAAACVMVAAVLALRTILPDTALSLARAAFNLCLLSVAGAAVHIGTQYLLWRLAGRPKGAERRVLSAATGLMRRLGWRVLAPATRAGTMKER
ncbi:oligosaccharide flippase family protein [Roseomonas sp. CAU 1739]|uniref:oligosaccharide flippase family protein n=1 Tax=Roseomonas sp. CAU 1739 TaxID=3140364 RepID=UPI00325C252C